MKYFVLVVFSVAMALVIGSPVPSDLQQSAVCSPHARLLLSNLSQLMDKKGRVKHHHLFAGFNCTEQTTQMIPFTQTAEVCQPITPANVSCVNQRNSTFAATECVRNIRDDLWYYNHMLKSYTDRVEKAEQDLNPVMMATTTLMSCLQESCPRLSAERTLPEWVVWQGSSFGDRLSLCKTLKGFHIRAITMNRALGYIATGDHRN